jgi:multidrug efflux pump subunit AcrA (membrane-fusion protein)
MMIRKIKMMCWCSLLLLASCNQPQETTTAKAGNSTASTKVQTVEVILPSTRSFNAQMQISGTAMPNQKAMIHAMESGYLRQLNKDIGDKVSKGEILARLYNPEISQQLAQSEADLAIAEAMLQTLQSELNSAKSEDKISASYFARLKSISEKTPALTPIVEVEKAEAATEMAKAKVATMEARIKAHQQRIEAVKKQVQYSKVRSGMLAIKAPFSGIITGRYLDVGSTLQSGISNSGASAIFEIQDIDPIRLTLPIPETNAAAVRKGMEVKVVFPELAGADFTAKVSRNASRNRYSKSKRPYY